MKDLLVIPPRPPPVSIDSGGHRQRVRAARDALVAAWCPGSAGDLVTPIAARLARRLPAAFELEDLVGAGNLGLLRAATRYRPSRGTPFPAFARPRIAGAILNSVRRKAWEESTRIDAPTRLPELAVDCCNFVSAIDDERLLARVALAITRLSARQQRVVRGFYAETRDTRLTCEAREKAIAQLRRILRWKGAAA